MKPYLQEFTRLKPYYILLPFLIVITYCIYHFSSPTVAIYLGKEDHFFEWLTAFALFGASIYFFLTFKKIRNYYFLLLALLMFFGAGEEVSWGQRIFHYATPESIKAANVQGEFTIHNLEVFNGKQFNKPNRSGLERLLEIDLLFKIFIFSFGILLPLAVWHLKPIAKLVEKLRLPVPPVSIGIFFFISWFGRAVVLYFLKEPPNGTDKSQFFAMLNAASEYYEFLVGVVLMIVSMFFYKNKYGADLVGKDVKELIAKEEMVDIRKPIPAF